MTSRILKRHRCLSYATRFLFLSTLVFLLLSRFAYAQSLIDLENVLKQHPKLQALTYQADSERALALSSMALPDPTVSLGINNFPIFDPSFDAFLPSNKALGFQQRFPSKAGRKARLKIKQATAVLSDVMHTQLFGAMRGELLALLHNKVRINRQKNLANQRAAKYRQLIDAVESEVDAGRPSVFRLAEIEAQRVEVSRTLADLSAETIQVDARLIYLLDKVPDTAAPVTTPTVWSGDPLDFTASRVAKASLSVTEGEVQYAKSQWKPEWGAQITYQQREAGRDFSGDDWVSAMVTFTVPFWAKKNQKPKLTAAKAAQRARQSSFENVQRAVTAQYASYTAAYASTLENKSALENKIRAIEAEISAQKRNYESGIAFYAPVIDGEIVILKLRAEVASESEKASVLAAQINALMVTK